MKWCPTCGTFHQPGAHGPATPPQRPPEQPPENPAPPPPDDSQADGGGAAESAVAGGGDGDDDKDSGEAPATGEPQQQPAANGRPRVRGNGGAAQAGQGRATLRTGPPAAADGAENAAGSPYSTGTYVPPPPPVDDPGIWHQYLQQLPPQDKARRQAARAQVQSQLADLNRTQRIEQGGVYVETAEELKFLEYTGYLPTLDDETDEATLTAERIRREKAAAAKERKKAREEGRLRRSDKERNRVVGAPNATVERDEYGTVTIDGRQVVGTSSSGGVITYQFEDGGIERFVLETGEDGAPQPDFSKGQVIRGVEGQKSLAEQYRAVSLDTDEARAWQQSEMNRIAKLPEPMQEEFRWYVDQVMSASNQNQLDLAQKGLADRWEEYGDSQTQAWRTEQMEHISANVSQGEQAEFQRLIDNVVNARTRDELESANKALSGHWDAWVAAENARRAAAAAAARTQAQQSRKIDTPQPTLKRDDDGTWMVDGRRVKQTISSGGTVTYFFEDGGVERFGYGTGADGTTQTDFSRGQVVHGLEGQKSLVEQYAPISLDTEGATAWQTAQQERIADMVPPEQQAEFRQLVDNVLNAENQQQLDAATMALTERWEKWDASVALTNTTTIQGHTEELATLSYADSPQFNDLVARMRASGLYTEESLDAMVEEWLTNESAIQGHNAELAALTESGPRRLADSPEFVDLLGRMRASGLYTEESLDALEAEAAIPQPPSLLKDDVEYSLVTESGNVVGPDTGVGYTMSEGPVFADTKLDTGVGYTMSEGPTFSAVDAATVASIQQQTKALADGEMSYDDIPPADRANFESYVDWYKYTGELPTFDEATDTANLARADESLRLEQEFGSFDPQFGVDVPDYGPRYQEAVGQNRAALIARGFTYNPQGEDALADYTSGNTAQQSAARHEFIRITGREPTGDPVLDSQIWRDAQTGQAAGDYLQSGLVYNQGLNAGSLDDFGEARDPKYGHFQDDYATPQRAPIVSGPDVAPPRLSYTEGLAGAQAVSQETGSVRFNTLDEWREQSGGTVYINNRAFEIDDLVTARYDSAGLKHRNPSNRGELRKEAEAKALAFLNSQPEGSITLQPRSYSPLTSLDELGETFYVDGEQWNTKDYLENERRKFENVRGTAGGLPNQSGWDEGAFEAATLSQLNTWRTKGRMTTGAEGPGAPYVQVGQDLTDTPLWPLPTGSYVGQILTSSGENSPGGGLESPSEAKERQFEGLLLPVDFVPFPGPGTAARGIRRAATGLVDAGGNLIQSSRMSMLKSNRISDLHNLSRGSGSVDDAARFDNLVVDYQGRGYPTYDAYEAAARDVGLMEGGDPLVYGTRHAFDQDVTELMMTKGMSKKDAIQEAAERHGFTAPQTAYVLRTLELPPKRPVNIPDYPGLGLSTVDTGGVKIGGPKPMTLSQIRDLEARGSKASRYQEVPGLRSGPGSLTYEFGPIYSEPYVSGDQLYVVSATAGSLGPPSLQSNPLATPRMEVPPRVFREAVGTASPTAQMQPQPWMPPLGETTPDIPMDSYALRMRERTGPPGGGPSGGAIAENIVAGSPQVISPDISPQTSAGASFRASLQNPQYSPPPLQSRARALTSPTPARGVAETPMVRTPAGLLVPAGSPALQMINQPGLRVADRTDTGQEGRLEEEEQLAARQSFAIEAQTGLRQGTGLDTGLRTSTQPFTGQTQRLDLDTPQRQRLDLDTPQRQRLDLDTPQRQRLDLDTGLRGRQGLDIRTDSVTRQGLDLRTDAALRQGEALRTDIQPALRQQEGLEFRMDPALRDRIELRKRLPASLRLPEIRTPERREPFRPRRLPPRLDLTDGDGRRRLRKPDIPDLPDSARLRAAAQRGYQPLEVEFYSVELNRANLATGEVQEIPVTDLHEETLTVTELGRVDTRGRTADTGAVEVENVGGRVRVRDSGGEKSERPEGRASVKGTGGGSGSSGSGRPKARATVKGGGGSSAKGGEGKATAKPGVMAPRPPAPAPFPKGRSRRRKDEEDEIEYQGTPTIRLILR